MLCMLSCNLHGVLSIKKATGLMSWAHLALQTCWDLATA